MKLYTREQMIEAFHYGKTLKGFDWIGDMIDSLEAIELPTDEEIENGYEPKTMYDLGYLDGAKKMRDKIQGGNNDQQ